jgi:hypothetical protein
MPPKSRIGQWEPCPSSGTLLRGHRQCGSERIGGADDVGRGHRQGAIGHLVERAGSLGQDEDRVALGNDDRLLGHEVHAVDQRVHEHDVRDRQAGKGLGVVVLVEDLDRPPARPPEARVDPIDGALDHPAVMAVLAQAGAGRHEEGEEA